MGSWSETFSRKLPGVPRWKMPLPHSFSIFSALFWHLLHSILSGKQYLHSIKFWEPTNTPSSLPSLDQPREWMTKVMSPSNSPSRREIRAMGYRPSKECWRTFQASRGRVQQKRAVPASAMGTVTLCCALET